MEPQPVSAWEIVAEIAGRQHRVVARRQLLAAGLSAGTDPRPDRESPGVPAPLHCSPSLLPYSDTTRRHRIPCTTVERTLIDVAASNPSELNRAVEQAFVKKLIGRTRMAEALERATGRPGTQRLRRALAGLLPQVPFTRSELERRFLRLLRKANLPLPVVNRHAENHRVDFHWPAHNLIVETDGRGIHDNPYTFEKDRARDLDLELAGFHVIRLSWRQVTEQPERVGELLGTRLRAARSAP